MPKRSNEFQDLVTLIAHAYSQGGDKVTPSAMVKVSGLETEREIDILIENVTAPYKIKVAVESKDEGRRMDLTTFESYLGKYRGEGCVPVDQFILVSRRGFTKGVVEKARLVNVPLMTLNQAKETDWSKFGPQFNNTKKESTFHLRLQPHIHDVEVVPSPGDGLEFVAGKEGRLICPQGHDHGTPVQFAQKGMKNGKFAPEMLKKIEDHAIASKDGHALARVDWNMPHQILRFRGKDYPLEKIIVNIHCTNAKGPTKCELYEMEGSDGKKRVIQYMTATAGNTVIKWAMPDGTHAKKIGIQFKKNAKDRAEDRKRQRKRQRRSK